MAYNAINTSEIEVDDPLTDELLGKIKDCLDDLNTRISSPLDIPNGNFQVDTDADGVPDNFTRSLYTGGSAAFDTATPYTGLQAYKFTRTSGAGNGGGYLDTTYLEISEFISPLVKVALKASAAGIKVMVQARYFDKDKAHLSDEDLYSSTANPTTWTPLTIVAIPPATANYMKIRLIGGYTDTDVAGDVYFGAIHYEATPTLIPVLFTIGQYTRNTGPYADMASTTIKLPKGFTYLSFPLETVTDGGTTGATRFRIGTAYTVDCPRNQTADINITGLSGTQSIYMQVKGEAPSYTTTASKYSQLGLCTR